jgi:hypothetical protein
MELKKWPKTEMEYWKSIETLGGFSWGMDHELADGRIKDPEGGIDKEIQEATEISMKLVAELEGKFGVIPPDKYPQKEPGQELPPAPEGKIYYWDWYHRIEEKCYRQEYEGMICSVCPYSEGLGEMIATGGRVLCGLWTGCSRLVEPYSCAMLRLENWDEHRLYEAIREKAAEEALKRFLEKKQELKQAYEKSRAVTV